jgi:hypothetical protein
LPTVETATPKVARPAGTIATPERGGTTWYRSDQDRNKSVYRRANPWYRRVARGTIGLVVLAALATGLYFGARAVQSYLDRDRLPSPGADVPAIRRTSFQVNSAGPAPVVDGTLTIDTASRAFEFVGRNGGVQAGVRAVSPDGSTVYVRRGDGGWQRSDASDPVGPALVTAVRYLADDNSADAILTNRLRRGYVDLVDETTEGTGDDELTRYDLDIDTSAFSVDYPLQWQDFQNEAIPAAATERALPVSIWLDTENVLVRVRDLRTNWSWERLAYSTSPFVPETPAAELLDATTGDATTPTSAPTTAGG